MRYAGCPTGRSLSYKWCIPRAYAPKFRKFTRFILGEATQEHKTALVSRAYCTYRVSDITQAQQDRLPWGGVCGRGGKANGHVSAPRGKGPASAALTSEQQLSK